MGMGETAGMATALGAQTLSSECTGIKVRGRGREISSYKATGK